MGKGQANVSVEGTWEALETERKGHSQCPGKTWRSVDPEFLRIRPRSLPMPQGRAELR